MLDLPAPKLYGRHQFENAGAAIAALRVSGLKPPSAAFEAGMIRVEWPARMQRLSHGRLAALAPPDSELWLDGGHNADGGRAIAAALADLEERVSRPLVLIVGMLSTKDCAGFLKNFSGLARRVITVPIHQEKTVPAAELAEIAGRSASLRLRATMWQARFRSSASSNCSRRRASSSPDRCISPARSWPPTARRRNEKALFPGRGVTRSGAPLIRDRFRL